MKFLKIFFALFVFFAAANVAQADELPFTDAGNEHFEAIYSMKDWGIFDGYSNGSFGSLKEGVTEAFSGYQVIEINL